jgi:hypothetical protein
MLSGMKLGVSTLVAALAVVVAVRAAAANARRSGAAVAGIAASRL